MKDANPRFSYTSKEEVERQEFLRDNPDWNCDEQTHVIGNGAINRTHDGLEGYVFKGFTATGCCWVCGKAVA